MLGSVILDVAIGMALIYFLFSLIVSSVTEFVSSAMELRARTLKKGIENLVQVGNDGVDDKYKNLLNDIYKHPLIYALYKEDNVQQASPSYIPAQTFSVALLDTLHKINDTGNDLVRLRQALESQRNTSLIAQGILSLIDRAQGSAVNVQKEIEQWFDASMQRVSGWYKKEIHKFVLVTSALIVIVFNVDTLHIANTLYHDQTLRGGMAGAAGSITQSYNPSASATTSAQAVQQELNPVTLPIGWPQLKENQSPGDYCLSEIFARIPGWIITFFAISLGAPFWFDILSKLVNMRQTGIKPDSDKTDKSSNNTPPPQPPAQPTSPPAMVESVQPNPFVSGDYKHE